MMPNELPIRLFETRLGRCERLSTAKVYCGCKDERSPFQESKVWSLWRGFVIEVI
jgi:hypothetical protein